MKNLLFPSLFVIFAAAAATPAAAQVRNNALRNLATPTVPHVANPGVSLSSPPANPLQAQEQDNYAAQLRGAQQQLLQQNPSGLTRPELGISRALNGFTPH